MNLAPHNDDGLPIAAPRWHGRGGRRAGAGRMPKPAMTAEEFELVTALRAKGYRKHGTSWVAAADLLNNRPGGRVGGAIDPRTRAVKGVSASWTANEYRRKATEIRLQQQSNEPRSEPLQHLSDGTSYPGTRIGSDQSTGDSAP